MKGQGFDHHYYPCSTCLPCRVRRAREWTTRQCLESYCHDQSSFVTLTYAPEHLPPDGSLRPEDPTLFLASLRKGLRDRGRPPVRYLLCGEYGDESKRPHYHLSLFGIGQEDEALIQHYWQHGFTKTAEFNRDTARYVTGYVTKYKTRPGDMGPDLVPEYARYSLRPGLGVPYVKRMAKRLLESKGGRIDLLQNEDVPGEIMIGNKSYPLGRTLLRKLREEVYGKNSSQIAYIKQKYSDKYEAEMQDMRESKGDPYYPPEQYITEQTLQHSRNLMAREKLNRHRRKL